MTYDYQDLNPEKYIENSDNSEEIEKYLLLKNNEQDEYIKKREKALLKRYSEDHNFKSEEQIKGIVNYDQKLFIDKVSKIKNDQILDFYNSLSQNEKIDYIKKYKDELINEGLKDKEYTQDKFENIELSANKQLELFIQKALKREHGEKPNKRKGLKIRLCFE